MVWVVFKREMIRPHLSLNSWGISMSAEKQVASERRRILLELSSS